MRWNSSVLVELIYLIALEKYVENRAFVDAAKLSTQIYENFNLIKEDFDDTSGLDFDQAALIDIKSLYTTTTLLMKSLATLSPNFIIFLMFNLVLFCILRCFIGQSLVSEAAWMLLVSIYMKLNMTLICP